MSDYGVTPDGFVLKSFDTILGESIDRARRAFPGADLTSTSALRKILETAAAEDGELWKSLEDLYYGNFVSTAVGSTLDQLGEDVGLERDALASTGTVTVTVRDPDRGRTYVLPEGAVLVATFDDGVQAFGTTAAVRLTDRAPQADVGVVAFVPGPDGDVEAATIVAIDPAYQEIYLSDLGGATIEVSNGAPTSGGTGDEADEAYRSRMLGFPRNLWTVESVAQAALGVRGVVDVLLSDPLGGVDVSQSYFDLFNFGQRAFSSERRAGEPYFFSVVVAHDFRFPWRSTSTVPGIFEGVSAAVDAVRPIGIHATIVEADHIEVGVRATLVIEPGSDGVALLASVRRQLAEDISNLRLGGDVLYSQVVRAFVEHPGVRDVQGLHLRRSPAAYGRITFGEVPFQEVLAEAAVGESLVMGPTELATFAAGGDADAFDVTVVTG